MDDNSKDAEIRARVTLEMYQGLKTVADGRGEQLPVIVREAVAEYLAKRLVTAGTQYPAAGADQLQQILRDKPELANLLMGLGRLLSAGAPVGATVVSSYGKPKRRKLGK